jgi:hypothetical protein
MTANPTEDGHHVSLPIRPLNIRNKPKVSIAGLAKAAVLPRRWIRRKHPPLGNTALLPSTERRITTPASNTEKGGGVECLDHPNKVHFKYVGSLFIPFASRE